jgi:hypothetical protein
MKKQIKKLKNHSEVTNIDDVLNELEDLKKTLRTKDKVARDYKEDEFSKLQETIKELSNGLQDKLCI